MKNEIAITGISGRFPESDNVSEWSQNLYNKRNLITESSKRWEPGLHSLPRKLGQLKDLSKFDNEFFDVSEEQANILDPQARILLESTYEAIVDAGYDPDDLRGRKIGVFVAHSFQECEEFFTHDIKAVNEYVATGCLKSLLANRISQIFDFKGRSTHIDTACSSGLVALNLAVQSIQRGEMEAAVVGGVNICLRPGTSVQFHKLGALSHDSTCRSFDADGDKFLVFSQTHIPYQYSVLTRYDEY
ncbi:fatty acid synthase [Nephila pilipes]|uniref:Fatty acid synthase n=1 Tax=Nephila pilipes TaxID=299642 RepID=A0A8X6KQP6_NEPPI|nr:fatty acid synthase [Nephila pilipes]